jgi:hypothetical protein
MADRARSEKEQQVKTNASTNAEHAALQRAHDSLVREHRRLELKLPRDLAEHAIHLEHLREHIDKLRRHRTGLLEQAAADPGK